jgi:hypothetical protein
LLQEAACGGLARPIIYREQAGFGCGVAEAERQLCPTGDFEWSAIQNQTESSLIKPNQGKSRFARLGRGSWISVLGCSFSTV